MNFEGRVEAIHLIPKRGAPPQPVEAARAVADQGLEGDRKFGDTARDGTPRPFNAITLIEAEALEAAAADYGLDLPAGGSRRNVTVRGVPLNHLVGRRFRLGDALIEGYELCEPCAHLEKLTGQPVRKALVHRGGLRAYVVGTGEVKVGDAVRPE